MFLYVCMISDPQRDRNLISYVLWSGTCWCAIQAQLYSGGSNESDLQEGSCDWSALIAHFRNYAPWDIEKHILAEQNRLNKIINHARSTNSVP